MNYVKAILSGLAAIFLAWIVILWPSAFRGISEQKATGLSVFVAPVFSPLFWFLAVLLLALFVAVSRVGNKFLRVLLFWIPTVSVSTLVVGIVALLTYAFIHLKHLSGR